MKFLPKVFAVAAIVSLISGLSGCASSLIDVRAGSDRVSLANASQVAGCKPKGKIIVSVLTKVGFINRSAEEVDANLFQLGRNAAVDAGGDTLVRESPFEYGKNTFAIYRCRP